MSNALFKMGDHNEICYSIVDYMSDHSGYKCGYCKSSDTNYSHGMWAHRMNVYTYFHLINRGWRRSGKYCYKPTMDKTCCPQYTIRCDIDNFKLSKSQKKVLKRMNLYLSYGSKKGESSDDKDCKPEEFVESEQVRPRHISTKDITVNHHINIKNFNQNVSNPEVSHASSYQADETASVEKQSSSVVNENKTKFKPGKGQDPLKPLCKKAKLQRKERHAAKSNPFPSDDLKVSKTSPSLNQNQTKSIEDHLDFPIPESPAHKLEMRLVPVSSDDSDFAKSYRVSYELFRKYQMAIHGDPPDECEETSYKSFLIDGPLRPYKCIDGPERGYGPFHQQYWLDGQLIAVGVLDILPCAVSSVYFYYDPKYSFLSLGTYSSLREIALSRELSRCSSFTWYYYMGFYIHSCPKMRYKGQYNPSYLLCPEAYKWVPIEHCLPKLDANKYSKLFESSEGKEVLDINKIQCMYDGNIVLYGELRRNHRYKGTDEEVKEYLKLVGNQASNMTLLYRS